MLEFNEHASVCRRLSVSLFLEDPMRRATVTLLAFALTVSFGSAQVTSQSHSQAANVIEDLLRIPAPTPQNVPGNRPEKIKFA
jgi:hypothetical protein